LWLELLWLSIRCINLQLAGREIRAAKEVKAEEVERKRERGQCLGKKYKAKQTGLEIHITNKHKHMKNRQSTRHFEFFVRFATKRTAGPRGINGTARATRRQRAATTDGSAPPRVAKAPRRNGSRAASASRAPDPGIGAGVGGGQRVQNLTVIESKNILRKNWRKKGKPRALECNYLESASTTI